MTISQGRVVRDGRRLPFFAITKAAMANLRAHFEGAQRKTAIAVYTTLVERCNDEGSDSVTAVRAEIAEDAGVHPSTLTAVANALAEAGLLEIERRRDGAANLPNRWTLVEPPLLASDEEGSSRETRRGRRLRRGGVAPGEDGSSPQTTEVVASDEEGSSRETSPVKEAVEEQEAAAAATRADAHVGAGAPRGGSSIQPPPDVSKLWNPCRAALCRLFTEEEVDQSKPDIDRELRRQAALATRIDWPAAGALLVKERRDLVLQATTPVVALRFALAQKIDPPTIDAKPKRPGRGTYRQPTTSVELPDATPEARDAWARLLDAIPDDWVEQNKLGNVLDCMRPLRFDGRTLEVSATVHAAYQAEPVAGALDRMTSDLGWGRVRWVAPDTAAGREHREAA